MKKQNRLTVCLAAGVLILAVSATAAFGSVNGYTTYKEAVKKLALKTDNVTISGTVNLAMDGKELMTYQMDAAIDGANNSTHATATTAGVRVEDTYHTMLNGVTTSFNADEKYYNTYSYENGESSSGTNLLGIENDDEMANRMITFMEIAADTVVGDLKNNFVQVGEKDGNTLYQVNISKSQVPSLVNAGLSLMAYSVAEQENYGRVIYENMAATEIAYYEKTTGEALSEEFKQGYQGRGDDDWYEKHDAQLEKFNEVTSKLWEGHQAQLEKKGDVGILFVKADGSTEYYATGKAFATAHPEETAEEFSYYIGEDMSLEAVACTFGVDKNGNLTSNQISATFSTTEKDGTRHEMTMKGDVTLKNFGSTTVSPLDVGNRTEAK